MLSGLLYSINPGICMVLLPVSRCFVCYFAYKPGDKCAIVPVSPGREPFILGLADRAESTQEEIRLQTDYLTVCRGTGHIVKSAGSCR